MIQDVLYAVYFNPCYLFKIHLYWYSVFVVQWPQKTDKRTNNNLQNITHETKDQVTRILLKTGVVEVDKNMYHYKQEFV
jgi:hypothetical protein